MSEVSNVSSGIGGHPAVLLVKQHSAAAIGVVGSVITAIGMFFLMGGKAETKAAEDKKQDAPPAQQQVPLQQIQYVPQNPNGVLQQQIPQNLGTSKSFVVASLKKTTSGLILLNDTADWKQAQTTVVIRNPALLGVYANSLDMLKGKMVTVQGTLGSYNGKPQIEATAIAVQ